jgi:hypothetical protein
MGEQPIDRMVIPPKEMMECGLKGLARLLGIPYAPSWESYLRQIQAKKF